MLTLRRRRGLQYSQGPGNRISLSLVVIREAVAGGWRFPATAIPGRVSPSPRECWPFRSKILIALMVLRSFGRGRPAPKRLLTDCPLRTYLRGAGRSRLLPRLVRPPRSSPASPPTTGTSEDFAEKSATEQTEFYIGCMVLRSSRGRPLARRSNP